MTVKEKLANPQYMAAVHLGHAAWWRERIGSGELDAKQMENALDMIRIHQLHAQGTPLSRPVRACLSVGRQAYRKGRVA